MSIALRGLMSTSNLCSRCLSRSLAYKSMYNIENLYPASRDIYSKTSENESKILQFSGEIPIKKVKVKYSKSSGPGGQHVNKTMSKAEVRFHVVSADWIPQHLRSIILEKFRTRISKNGELIVWNDDSRYQMQNVKNCLDQIKEIIKVAQTPPDTSKEERIAELYNMDSIQAAHKKRLVKKRLRSFTKSMRNFHD